MAMPISRATTGRSASWLQLAVITIGVGALFATWPSTVTVRRSDDRPCAGSLARRDTHLFPHGYVGEVFVRLATTGTGITDRVTIAWGPWRWRDTLPVAPDRSGGTIVLFSKRDGADRPNITVVARSEQPVCIRWGTADSPTGGSLYPFLATGWTRGTDRV